MTSPNPYAVHALLLVYGADRNEIARKLREEADRIERGASEYITQGADGAVLIRDATPPEVLTLSEEAGVCRMYAVNPDGEGSCASDAWALFGDKEQAERFKQNLPPYEPDDAPSMTDHAIVRADVILTVWNSYDPDPHAPEGT